MTFAERYLITSGLLIGITVINLWLNYQETGHTDFLMYIAILFSVLILVGIIAYALTSTGLMFLIKEALVLVRAQWLKRHTYPELARMNVAKGLPTKRYPPVVCFLLEFGLVDHEFDGELFGYRHWMFDKLSKQSGLPTWAHEFEHSMLQNLAHYEVKEWHLEFANFADLIGEWDDWSELQHHLAVSALELIAPLDSFDLIQPAIDCHKNWKSTNIETWKQVHSKATRLIDDLSARDNEDQKQLLIAQAAVPGSWVKGVSDKYIGDCSDDKRTYAIMDTLFAVEHVIVDALEEEHFAALKLDNYFLLGMSLEMEFAAQRAFWHRMLTAFRHFQPQQQT